MQDIVNALVLPAIDAIVVYDVGQVSAAAAVNANQCPLIYFDFGGGILANLVIAAIVVGFRRYLGRNAKFATLRQED